MKAQTKSPATIDEYLERVADPAKRSLLEKLRQAIRSAAPGAQEVISYQMPAYKQNGMLVYFAAFSNHCSLFPASRKVFDAFKTELAAYKTSKGTIQFTVDHPLPLPLIKKIVKAKLKENEEKMVLKKRAE
jgi:uncharacterized protein YdhG (YjbR/CyaY superfamily)